MTRAVMVVFLGMLAAFAAFDIWLWSARMAPAPGGKALQRNISVTPAHARAGGDSGYAHREVLAGRPRKNLMRLRPAPPKRRAIPRPLPQAPINVAVRAVLVEVSRGDPAVKTVLLDDGSPFSRALPASRLAPWLTRLDGGGPSRVIARPELETLLETPTRIVLDLGDEAADTSGGAEPASESSPPTLPAGNPPGRMEPAAARIELEFTVSRAEAGTLLADLHSRLTGGEPCPGVPGAREMRTKLALGADQSALIGGLAWCAPSAASQTPRRRELVMILTPELGGKSAPPTPIPSR